MSNIPSSAISDALTPVQRATQETQRARKIQSNKNVHHSEEVNELDDTAVNSVNGQKKEGEHGGDGGGDAEAKDRPDQEQVEIESLQPAAKLVAAKTDDAAPHLDICA